MMNFWMIVLAIITANTISVVVASLAMCSGGFVKWISKRYAKMFEILEEEL